MKKSLILIGLVLIMAALFVMATPAATVAAQTAATPDPTQVQFEACAGCHEESGALHQKYYSMLYQDGIIKVSNVTYKFAAGVAGKSTDTIVVTFKMTKDGKPYSGAAVENLNIYYAAYTGTAFEGAGRLALKGKVTYDEKNGTTTSTLAELADPKAQGYVDYVDVGKGGGILVVYGYDKQVGTLPERIKQVQFPYAAILKFGKVDYASAANNDGCEKCHTDPYLKHGNIYGQVGGDPKTDFVTCKVCHLDNGAGGHLEWQLLADDPEVGAKVMSGELQVTEEQKTKYAYKTTLMNDVHMSHAMEFPYPQSMANCVTCHEGKLDKVLSDANFNITTCKSCHPQTGSVKKDGEAVVYDTTTYALATILPKGHDMKSDCVACHAEGKSAPVFSKIHTGYDKAIYTADGKRIADIVKVSIDKVAYKDNILTVTFSAAASEDIGLDPKTITPTVMVGLYGWNTKDFVVGAHERLIDDNKDGAIDSKDGRALEMVLDGKATNPRVKVNSAKDGVWEVAFDLSPWKDLMANKTVTRAEIGFMPALVNKDKVAVAVNAVSKTVDLTTGRFVKFYPQVVKVEGCNDCHDALATNFHSPAYGGSVTVCSMCHIVKAGGSHLEMQSRTIDSYIHAIHNSQQFDIAGIDFADPAQAEKYAIDSELPFPKHGITNCEACHNPGTYDVPSQSKTLPGILSPSAATLKGKTRSIGEVPAFVTGPASMACGSCHRAELINEDNAEGLALFNRHITQYGYMVPAGEKPLVTLDGVWKQIMSLFK